MKLQASPVKQFALALGMAGGAAAQPAAGRQVPRGCGSRRAAIEAGAARRDGGRRLRPDPAAVGARPAAAGLPEHPCLAAAALARRRADPPRDRGRRQRDRHHHHADGRGPGHRRHAAARARAIAPDDTTGSLHDRLAALGGRHGRQALAGAAAGSLQPVPQPAEGVTYAHKIDKAEAQIDWSQPAERDRAPHPRLRSVSRRHCQLDGETIKLWAAQRPSPGAGEAPGNDFGRSARPVSP